MAPPAILKLYAFRRWSCSTPVTCDASFFLIGQVIEFTCDLLELRLHLHDCVTELAPARIRSALMRYSWIRCDVSSAHSSANLFRTRITCVAYHLPPSGVGILRSSSERTRFSAASAASSLVFAWIA